MIASILSLLLAFVGILPGDDTEVGLCTPCLTSSCSFAVIQKIMRSADHLPTSCCTLMGACPATACATRWNSLA